MRQLWDVFDFLKFAIWGRRMATYDQSLNLYWGQTKQCFANLRTQKVSKFNLWSISDSLAIAQGM